MFPLLLSPSPYDLVFLLLSFQLSRNNLTGDACYANVLNTTISSYRVQLKFRHLGNAFLFPELFLEIFLCVQERATQSAENEENPGYGSASQPGKVGQPRSCNQVLSLILRERTLERALVRNKIPPKLAGYARAPEFQNTP